MELQVNGQPRAVPAGSNIAELLAELGVTAKHVAVEVNQQLVPRADHHIHKLAEGDRLEIVTLVGGG